MGKHFFHFLTVSKLMSLEPFVLLAVGCIGLASFGTGGYFTYESHFRHPQASYIPVDSEWSNHLKEIAALAKNAQTTPLPSIVKSITVDISGAIKKPGIYNFSSGARIQEVVLAAGGFLAEADQEFIHQKLNLATTLQDQQKIYIPFQGQPEIKTVTTITDQKEKASTSNQSWWEYFNTASEKELIDLPVIGEKTAAEIMEARPFESESDATARSGLTTNEISKIVENIY